jgi:hypothetical protein
MEVYFCIISEPYCITQAAGNFGYRRGKNLFFFFQAFTDGDWSMALGVIWLLLFCFLQV